MSDYNVMPGLFLLLFLAPVGMAAWILLQWFPIWLMGKNLRKVLDDITLPESILFGLYAVGAAIITGQIFSRFI